LLSLLQRNDLIQFAQRVSVDYHLRPFAPEETPAYIAHRLKKAGASGPIFSDPACRLVHHLTDGNPRLINQVCDMALAYGYAEQAPLVTAAIVHKVADDRRAGGILPVAEQGLGWELTPHDLVVEQEQMALAQAPCPSIANGTTSVDQAGQESSLAYARGLAYKQAGLYKQAIASFSTAAADPMLSLRANTQLAVCYCAGGRAGDAIALLQSVLARDGGSASDRRQARYVLARAFESAGMIDAAVTCYRELDAEEPGFRDASARLQRLSVGAPWGLVRRLLKSWAWVRSPLTG
jgi:tetratricopeptide (TPR) repeat protein